MYVFSKAHNDVLVHFVLVLIKFYLLFSLFFGVKNCLANVLGVKILCCKFSLNNILERDPISYVQ